MRVYFYYPRIIPYALVPESEGKYEKCQPGNYIWTVKTYGYLKQAGCECELTTQFPSDGIILTHRDFLPDDVIPARGQLLVCIVADTQRHPFAQVHVLQNPRDPMLTDMSQLWPAHFIPHWPETGLIPRSQARGDAFQNISYFGLLPRLAPQLQTAKWRMAMRGAGFNWNVVPPERWNDYSDTDAVVAVRSFASVPYYRNPATKLYNAWIAHVPALLGQESAYQAERRNGLDYIECSSVNGTIAALMKLRSEPETRMAIAENGVARARDVSPSAITARWERFIHECAIPEWRHWTNLDSAVQREFMRKRARSYRALAARELVHRGAWYVRRSFRARTWR